MGRYRKKPYKKKQIDPWHEWDLQEEIQHELESYKNDTLLSDPYLEEETMHQSVDEPEIVKILREEERNGKLPSFLPDADTIEFEMPEFKEYEPIISENSKKPSQNKIQSYEDAYKLAKKAFNQL